MPHATRCACPCERYESGYSAYLNVLDAQRTLNISQLALIRNRQALLSASVDLMKALGGGWTDATPLACVRARRAGRDTKLTQKAIYTRIIRRGPDKNPVPRRKEDEDR